jgi:hypothetical protein
MLIKILVRLFATFKVSKNGYPTCRTKMSSFKKKIYHNKIKKVKINLEHKISFQCGKDFS